jgi:hypothetical protein
MWKLIGLITGGILAVVGLINTARFISKTRKGFWFEQEGDGKLYRFKGCIFTPKKRGWDKFSPILIRSLGLTGEPIKHKGKEIGIKAGDLYFLLCCDGRACFRPPRSMNVEEILNILSILEGEKGEMRYQDLLKDPDSYLVIHKVRVVDKSTTTPKEESSSNE